MKVKFKKLHEDAVLPNYAKSDDAGMDITATSDGLSVNSGGDKSQWYYVEYRTGLAMEIEKGYVGLLFPRSSISKSALSLSNAVGMIDPGYRGEICFRFKVDAGLLSQSMGDSKPAVYKKGDRIGQLIVLPFPTIEPEWSDELSESERGTGGFGSTDIKQGETV
jgi:dUTP pyrophosphatase